MKICTQEHYGFKTATLEESDIKDLSEKLGANVHSVHKPTGLCNGHKYVLKSRKMRISIDEFDDDRIILYVERGLSDLKDVSDIYFKEASVSFANDQNGNTYANIVIRYDSK